MLCLSFVLYSISQQYCVVTSDKNNTFLLKPSSKLLSQDEEQDQYQDQDVIFCLQSASRAKISVSRRTTSLIVADFIEMKY